MSRWVIRVGAGFVATMPTACSYTKDMRRAAAVEYRDQAWAQRDAKLLREWGDNAWVEETIEEAVTS